MTQEYGRPQEVRPETAVDQLPQSFTEPLAWGNPGQVENLELSVTHQEQGQGDTHE